MAVRLERSTHDDGTECCSMEDQLLEIEALKAIFMEEFHHLPSTVSKATGQEFCIRVFPYIAGAEQNHLAIDLHVKFGNDYPQRPPEQLRIKPALGQLSASVLAYLNEVLLFEAEQLIGQPMIFALIEKMKEHLEMYNADAVEGIETFAKLSDELTTYIFSFLSMKELCTASYVNKTWHRLANDNTLWRTMSNTRWSEMLSEIKEHCPNCLKQVKRWKTFYRHLGDINFKFWGDLYPFLVVVMEPKGTELKVDHNNWITSFTESLIHQSEGCVALVNISETSGLVHYSSPTNILPLHIGKYMFITAETAERWYGATSWYRYAAQLSMSCPWVGRILGCFCWRPESDKAHSELHMVLLDAAMRAAKGPIARADLKAHWNPSVIEEEMTMEFLTLSPSAGFNLFSAASKRSLVSKMLVRPLVSQALPYPKNANVTEYEVEFWKALNEKVKSLSGAKKKNCLANTNFELATFFYRRGGLSILRQGSFKFWVYNNPTHPDNMMCMSWKPESFNAPAKIKSLLLTASATASKRDGPNKTKKDL